MNNAPISQYLWNVILAKAMISWLISCILKATLASIKTKSINYERLFGNGGMPSSHTAITTALAAAVGQQMGFHTVYFAIAVVFALVVMSDAAGVRMAAGNQARVINEILETMHREKTLLIKPEKLTKLLGHTPLEVLFGAILGVTVGLTL
ncbi:MAG: divergent PAP2 family protein [Clostridia bacterium]|nr:divergent PAP2 family protein [Clostridia bacterium]